MAKTIINCQAVGKKSKQDSKHHVEIVNTMQVFTLLLQQNACKEKADFTIFVCF